ncbi:MAG: guanylate kinase [Selenomonadaceae bacterium]|nr:guanylate kinase [Selenomonadaceae bacterium]
MANKVYAFFGPHCSGKSTMISQLMSMGVHYIPTVTTKYFDDRYAYKRRLYQTVKPDEFAKEKFIVQAEYQGNKYGLRKSEVLESYQKHKVSIMIMMDIENIKQLSKFINQDLITISLMIDDVVFVDRMLRAGCTNDEIKYFVEYADQNKEFDSYKVTDYIVKNIATPRAALEQILAIMGLVTLVPQKEFDQLVK